MSDLTPNYSFILPTVGGDTNAWGGMLRSNWEQADTMFAERLDTQGDDMEGALGLIPGTVGAPALYFVGDTNTGIYQASASKVSFSVDGAKVAEIDADGIVLPGTKLLGYVSSVQHGYFIPVQVDANNGGFDLFARLSGALTQLVRFVAGKVGIGTNDPKTTLHLNGNAGQTAQSLGGASIDCRLGNLFYKTISGNTTFTFDNPPASGTAYGFVLELTNGGSATVTWPASVKWPLGIAPSLTAAGVDVLAFYTRDGGTTWRGILSQQESS